MTSELKTYEPGQFMTRVPGRARAQAAAMRDFDEGVAELRRRYKPAFWSLFIPEVKDVYRWRVKLSCGCVHEVFVHGEASYPDSSRREDPMTQSRLPEGEFWCSNDHADVQKVYRGIVEWIEPTIREFPADPEEPAYEGMDAETWAHVRRTEPHSSAFWRVKLSCGHFYDHVVTDVDWRPEDGPELTTPERALEMRRGLEELWATDPAGWPEIGPERDHVVKMLEMRWPRPNPEQDCYVCRHAMRIVGYQRIGALAGPAKESSAESSEAKKRSAEARLARAEAEVRRLRAELAQSAEEDEVGDAVT